MDSAKSIIRIRLRKNREDYFKSLSESAKARLNQSLIKNILSLIPANTDGPVAGFWPMAFEPDVRPVLENMIQQKRKALLPVVQAQGMPLVFRNWKPGDRMQETSIKTMEPFVKTAIYDPEVLLIPLLGFDNRGHRLGHGAGFYDRTLMHLHKRKKNILTIGVAYEMQRVNELPMASYDQALDWVVTEDKTHKFI